MSNNTQGQITVHNVNAIGTVTADKHLYCGRSKTPKGLINANLGNPHPVGAPCPYCRAPHQRGAAIGAYDDQLTRDPDHPHHKIIRLIGLRVHQGFNMALYCHCDPRPCHCDVIKRRALNEASKLASLASDSPQTL